MNVTTKILMRACLLAFAVLLAACASPDANNGNGTPDATAPPPVVVDTTVGAPSTVKPDPAKPVVVPADTTAKLPPSEVVDHRCKIDADCAIKDVGSCCGRYPQCVNRDSPTFPEQVKAQCADDGRMSVCGFPSISGCQCVQGQCAGVSGPDSGDGALQ